MESSDRNRELLRKNANLLIDHGAKGPSVAAELGLLVAARKGTEGVGGRLALTPSALFFHAHAGNRVRPDFGIPLDEIAALRDVSRGLSRQLEVELLSGTRARFVVWGVPRLIAAIDEARAAL
ncbi:hypothetical protein [Curtobacterium sp. MCBD17_032]|uniref:hypothetical protein n=1 Tax=Curtobacterium sp. MCBD17_032 TaxID=2175659 RepID=UPI0011B5A465|nr:hypothetical protein [Curtobacterium sp. MCBD17_032]